jgi:hypothetical protein
MEASAGGHHLDDVVDGPFAVAEMPSKDRDDGTFAVPALSAQRGAARFDFEEAGGDVGDLRLA